MARTLRLIFALVVALIGGLLIAPPAHAAGTNTVVFHVTDPDGAPIAFTGWIYTGGNGSGNGGTGDLTWNNVADGDYNFAVSAASMDGTYVWYDGSATGTTTKPAPTHLAGGQTLEMWFQFPRLATLSGTVTTHDGDPLPNLTVSINRLGMVKSVATDSSGHYTFGYLRSGNVTIATQGSGEWIGAPSQQLTIDATGNQTKDFVLNRAGSIDGTLVFDRDGSPAPGITVQAYTKATVAYAGTGTTDAAGHFHIGGLATADFILRYTDPLYGVLRPIWWSGNAWTSDTATPVSVTSGAASTHDERLSYPDPAAYGHTLSGTVTDAAGTPLAGIDVTASDGTDTTQTTTNRDGRWALSTPDGSWKIQARSGATLQSLESRPPWYPQYYAASGVADTATQATPVSVSGGAATDAITITLTRAARLKTTVGMTGSSATVTGTWTPYTTGGTALGSAITDDQGNPLFRPGSYKLLVTGKAGSTVLLPRWYPNAASMAAAQTLTFAAGDDVAGTAVGLGAQLTATRAATITGSAIVGGTLTGHAGSWNLETGTTVVGTWKRGTTVVGTGASYRPSLADAGLTLSYGSAASNSAFGHTFTANTTTSVKVVRLASKTSMKAKALRSRKVRFTITVSGPVSASGTVTIRRGSVVVGTAKVSKGKAVITVKRQPRGKKSYRATFNGSTPLATSQSKTVKVKVR